MWKHCVVSTEGIAARFNRSMVLKDIKILGFEGVNGEFVLVKHPDAFMPDITDLCQVVESDAMEPDVYYMFGGVSLEEVLKLGCLNRGDGVCGIF